MANRLYIGARYVPVPFNNPDGSYNWLPGVAYEGLTIVIYDHRSYISKKPVPAISTPPSEDTEHWVDAYLFNADVAEALLSIEELQEIKADKDGVYASLWAGELISKDRQVDNTPYLFRNTGGSLKRIAPLAYPTLIGASVAENQLCNGESVTVPNGHKYYLKKSDTESLGESTGSAITGLTSGSDMVIDLTQMLGSAIADYAYSLDTNGIAWLRSYGFITDDYKPYNAGTIESVEATAKVVRDENGENAVTYPLGSDVLRGIFKLDTNNNLYADGDRKESDGTKRRRYSIVNLGRIDWINAGEYKLFYATALNENIGGAKAIRKAVSSTEVFSWGIDSKALTKISYAGISKKTPYSICVSTRGNILATLDTKTTYTEATFKTAMDGVYMVYELATPTTETSTPFTSPQVCYPDGTEEYVTENGVPVGHETEYPYDLVGLVENLINVPDVPSTNGTYKLQAVRTSSGVTYNWVTD